jgi:hypothetical protein
MQSVVYLCLLKSQKHGALSLDVGSTLDSRTAWSSSVTHDAATSALSVLTSVDEIFESINEETS